MPTARELFDAGRLNDAIQELNQQVKARPADASLRVFLFELLCFKGDFDRAGKQLDVLASQTGDVGIELAIQVYRALLAAEGTRHAVFHGDALPKFIAAPRPHVERYVLLLKKLATASADDLGAMLEEAEDESPAVAGERGGDSFASFRDADDRVAAVLEVFHDGEYLWVPFDQIARLEITPPKKLRELMWTQARLEIHGQPPGDVFIPARYVDSHLHREDSVKLGRVTEWTALHDRMVIGHGQRVFLVDGGEVSLLDLGAIAFATPAAGAPSA